MLIFKTNCLSQVSNKMALFEEMFLTIISFDNWFNANFWIASSKPFATEKRLKQP